MSFTCRIRLSHIGSRRSRLGTNQRDKVLIPRSPRFGRRAPPSVAFVDARASFTVESPPHAHRAGHPTGPPIGLLARQLRNRHPHLGKQRRVASGPKPETFLSGPNPKARTPTRRWQIRDHPHIARNPTHITCNTSNEIGLLQGFVRDTCDIEDRVRPPEPQFTRTPPTAVVPGSGCQRGAPDEPTLALMSCGQSTPRHLSAVPEYITPDTEPARLPCLPLFPTA